mmetsp:Transcript_9461/g.14252  ORF Transcript_9461/g.14252 Transcript_9461/m.14252 type:complete len:199 (-) Transcript_9461:58-654(-)|eukprot:CAMPEP_0185036662 /NCGR_PEP_ID=MMETSP1103-20130426/29922_1 /TAXON_ID=36769 /ORGANISM="Paraphysomonas bandaiensis, Strain Caron Lab Isolate" /LENGTH=198 /DNA_ID=CAMNT_0027574273 /DNA_START=35 /DNA_END=631 /DNA_ORIENTATION=+
MSDMNDSNETIETNELNETINLPNDFTDENFQDMILSWVELKGAIPPYYDRFKSWNEMKPFQKKKVIRLWNATSDQMKQEIKEMALQYRRGLKKRSRPSKKSKKTTGSSTNTMNTVVATQNSRGIVSDEDRQLEKKLRVDAAKFLCTHSNPELKALSETFLGNIVRGVPNVFETNPPPPPAPAPAASSNNADINHILL